MRHATGWLPSPPDSRDKGLDQLLGAAAPSPDSCTEYLPLLSFVCDQKSTQSCVLNAIQQQHFLRQVIQGVASPIRMSRLFPYYNSRVQHGSETLDIGTIPRCTWKVLKGLGICSEATWSFAMDKINTKPSQEAFQEAIDQLWLEGYYSLLRVGSTRVDDVKQALSAGYPVVFGMDVGDEFHDYEGGIYEVPDMTDGRHMTCLVGYEPDGAWLINSWGQNTWGTKPDNVYLVAGGFAKISWDVIAWSGASDFWVAKHAVEFVP